MRKHKIKNESATVVEARGSEISLVRRLATPAALTLVLLIAFPSVGRPAAVFRCTDDDGKVHYSDLACDSSQADALVRVNVIEPSADSRAKAAAKLKKIGADNRARDLKRDAQERRRAGRANHARAQRRREDESELSSLKRLRCRSHGRITHCYGTPILDEDGNVLPEPARAAKIDRLEKRLEKGKKD